MKITFSLLLLLLFTACGLYAQPDGKTEVIRKDYAFEVTTNKTSSIVFPAVIRSVDRGSSEVLAQKAKGVGNVLQLKAARIDFPQTNLTVITADGTLYHFTINYAQDPETLTLDIGLSNGGSSSLMFEAEFTEADYENYSTAISQQKRFLWFKRETTAKISLALLGVYVKDEVMFFRIKISNRSNINYDVALLKFYIRDRSRVKRTAFQENNVEPLYIFGENQLVRGKAENELVYAVRKFTIPDSKLLNIEMQERNGGRHVGLAIKNKTIVGARLLP